jgi:hypothetical protein
MGAEPGVRTKIMGETLVDAMRGPFNSNGGLSINCFPSSCETKIFRYNISLGSLKTLARQTFWKEVSLSS